MEGGTLRMPKKYEEPGLTIGTLILLVIGVVVLVFLIIGFTVGWNFFFDKFEPQEKFVIYEELETCTSEENFLFLFNKVRLQERNISFEDFAYVTYLDSEILERNIICALGHVEDCFVYEINEECTSEKTEVERLIFQSAWKCNINEDRTGASCIGGGIEFNLKTSELSRGWLDLVCDPYVLENGWKCGEYMVEVKA